MKTHVASGRVGQRTETEKTIGNGKGEMERDEDVTLTGMQTHLERGQPRQANKCSGWNLVYVTEE